MVDKNYCMSSYMAFRYIENDDKDFFKGMKHKNKKLLKPEERILVKTAEDIDRECKKAFKTIENKKHGILLSGGMDSAIVASYMPGSNAYTFRFMNGEYQKEELANAEYYANTYNLKLHYIDISWDKVQELLPVIMKNKCAPVHSIETQILQGLLEAKNDGMEVVAVGESADLVFGGMDGLMKKDWTFDEFVERYIFTDPKKVLREPVDMRYLFERYRQGDKIDFLKFLDEVFSVESSSSYMNAFEVAGLEYFDPYANLMMADPLDIQRVRSGETKYLIRELFKMKYPDRKIPEKVPMPRPVDFYFKNWSGPTRKEFKRNLNMEEFTGNQKWQLYCLEAFLNQFDR